jgi:hypothetical protein
MDNVLTFLLAGGRGQRVGIGNDYRVALGYRGRNKGWPKMRGTKRSVGIVLAIGSSSR